MALAYATSNRGGCHLRAYAVSFDVLGVPEKFDPLAVDVKKVEYVKIQQDYFAYIDSIQHLLHRARGLPRCDEGGYWLGGLHRGGDVTDR